MFLLKCISVKYRRRLEGRENIQMPPPIRIILFTETVEGKGKILAL